ncbi:MAG: hypothetical protein QF629_02850 [Alphaproteobacteria bacterium]|nr:hypothetical protein [Alphaproteobacteria bacterium]MDP6237937.1 hypothetical protein [Alphaproteobacteria bacterium]MDP7172243.1 hypothetical protein [Alphaproteobacteria bacterium]MDP7233148.1 hypothetical protein [Alphaproteobacteria bacterium]MDP7486783.1 hypothetical protein [Alphaproteobacteria bacterium]
MERFTRRPLEQVYFPQARTLLRVAQAEARLEDGCHAAIGTIADALYRSSSDHHEAFRTLLMQEHLWDTEATSPVGTVQAISAVIRQYLGNTASPVGAWVTLGNKRPGARLDWRSHHHFFVCVASADQPRMLKDIESAREGCNQWAIEHRKSAEGNMHDGLVIRF